MNTLLDRKLRRDLRRQLGALIAITIVVGCGIATFVGMRTMVHALEGAQGAYYAESRFPDLFAQVRAAPDALLPALRAIPGVEQVTARASGEVVVRLADRAEPATLRLVGLLDDPAALNRVVLRRGRLPLPDETDAIAVSEGFAEANALALGDTIGAVIGDRWRALRVVGIGIAAEIVYELRPGDVFPDPERYGVAWLADATVRRALDLDGAWNDLALRLAPGANPRAVLAALDAVLGPYGTLGAYDRARHASHVFLSEEIRQNRTFAVLLPLIFLAVAAFLVHLVLGRVVQQQREQIGTLKAFGLPLAPLLRHYVRFALVPTLAGAVLGVLAGRWLAQGMAAIYADFFRFPSLSVALRPGVVASAVLIGSIAAVLGAVSALRRVLRLAPAEAMRPEPPARYAQGVVERLLGHRGSPVLRMIARGMTHRPWRTVLGALGIGLGAAVVVAGTFGFDAVDRMRSVLFERATHADVTVVFAEPRHPAVRAALLALPGVQRVELREAVGVRVSAAQRHRQTALVGVEDGAELSRVVGLDGATVRIAASGVTLSRALARALGVGPGDRVDLEFLDGRGRRVTEPVAALVDDLSGLSVYVPQSRMAALVGAGEAVTGADLRVDAEALDALFAQLMRAPAVQSVTSRDRLRASFDRTIGESFALVLVTMVTLAGTLAAATIYNAGRVTLSERARDLASLRVLGFTQGEVARILFGELSLLALMGLPLGLLIGVGFAWATVQGFGSGELFRLPLVIGPRTLLAGLLIPVLAGLLTAWPLWYRLRRLDLLASLTTRE